MIVHLRKIATAFSIFSVAKLASVAKISFVVGSCYATFSLSNGIAPLTGAVLNPGMVTLFFLGNFILRFLVGIGFSAPLFSLKFLSFHIPGMVAAFYWSSRSRVLTYMIVAAATASFLIHPVGQGAWLYTLLWAIPLVAASIPSNIFFTALTSTFLAHAVGSVIWLYASPMTVAAWIGLIPLILAERLFFALSMTMCYYAAINVKALCRKRASSVFLGQRA